MSSEIRGARFSRPRRVGSFYFGSVRLCKLAGAKSEFILLSMNRLRLVRNAEADKSQSRCSVSPAGRPAYDNHSPRSSGSSAAGAMGGAWEGSPRQSRMGRIALGERIEFPHACNSRIREAARSHRARPPRAGVRRQPAPHGIERG